MKALFFGIIVALFLGACSAPPALRHELSPPAHVLKDFLSAVREKRYRDTLDKLSADTLREHKEDVATQKDVDNYFAVASTFGFLIVEKIHAYEEIGSKAACLTTSGYSAKGEPVSLNVALVLENELWKIDSFHTIFHQSPQEFPSKANCPTPEE